MSPCHQRVDVARTKQRSTYTIYEHPRMDGWVLTSTADTDVDRHRATVVSYFIGSEYAVVTDELPFSRIDGYLRQYGAIVGAYEGPRPEPNVASHDQPRAVRMQRHGYPLYQALGHARGLSPTLAVKAAETFGSTWDEKTEAADWERVDGIGSGRADSIAEAVRRL